MINLILGQPGGGKSYEAVAFHLIPAIVEQGRKVITNLPLNLPVWESYWPGSTKLIVIREPELLNGEIVRPFAKAEHYGDTWRHPVTGIGPLYVIDECHLAIPIRSASDYNQVPVEEWYSLHRHELADVLLITQSYGKINKAIRDLVQVVYRCKKATALGFSNKYIRKVQDGLRGEVVNTTDRKYEKKYFPLYRSHTRSSSAGSELGANDIVPIWKHWTFKGAAIFLIFGGVMLYKGVTHEKKITPTAQHVEERLLMSPVVNEAIETTPAPTPRGPDQKLHPYDGYSLHLSALVHARRMIGDQQTDYLSGYITIASNGQAIRQVSFDDLRLAGYELAYQSDTVLTVSFQGYDLGYVVADLPSVSLVGKSKSQTDTLQETAVASAGGLPLAGGAR